VGVGQLFSDKLMVEAIVWDRLCEADARRLASEADTEIENLVIEGSLGAVCVALRDRNSLESVTVLLGDSE
jgi:hypothetical protein